MNAESIIFDLDGTLWDSSDNVAASWSQTIRDYCNPLLRNITITGEDIRAVMGMPMDAIAAKLFPMLSVTRQSALMEKCADEENNYLASHGGSLFDGTEKVLGKLSKEHRLFIVSNCQCGYIEAFFEFCGLERFFTDYLCWGDTGKPKSETIKMLMMRNNCSSAVYVGDTQGDCDSAADAGIPFIHAAYGFGTITAPEKTAASIQSISELADLFGMSIE